MIDEKTLTATDDFRNTQAKRIGIEEGVDEELLSITKWRLRENYWDLICALRQSNAQQSAKEQTRMSECAEAPVECKAISRPWKMIRCRAARLRTDARPQRQPGRPGRSSRDLVNEESG